METMTKVERSEAMGATERKAREAMQRAANGEITAFTAEAFVNSATRRADRTIAQQDREIAELRQQLASAQAVARKAVRQMTNAEEENARLRGTWAGAMAVAS